MATTSKRMRRLDDETTHILRTKAVAGARRSCGLLLATAAQTAAQQPPDAAQTLSRWTSPTPADQLAADTTVVPSGMGALFVPAMTGSDEPEALVFQGEKRVGGGPNGRRIVLAPGATPCASAPRRSIRW